MQKTTNEPQPPADVPTGPLEETVSRSQPLALDSLSPTPGGPVAATRTPLPADPLALDPLGPIRRFR